MRLAVIVFAMTLLFCDAAVLPFSNENWKSGYLSTGEPVDALFYLLFKNRKNNATAPLVIWLNGGPGCSSAYGIYEENGPVFVNNKTLAFDQNQYSWNNFADMLYVDQPAGVGLSISRGDDSLCKEETCVARAFYAAFLGFLEKFPEYKKRELYFSGESYAGHYIPAIAAYFAKAKNPDINLIGAAIGNPLTDLAVQLQGYPLYLYENNIFGIWKYLLARLMAILCHTLYSMKASPELLSEVCDFSFGGLADLPNVYDIRDKQGYERLDNVTIGLMNNKDAQKELGVNVNQFVLCNMTINTMMSMDIPVSQTFNLEYLVQNGYRIMMYFGDKDYICNWRGGEVLVNDMSWAGKKGFQATSTKNWKTDDGKVAGTYRKYDNFNFVTVSEAGHMVPLNQPLFALSMFEKFILNKFDQ